MDPAVTLTLGVGLAATAIGLIPAVLTGRWLARARTAWRAPVTAVVMAPMVLPPVVVGLLLLDTLGRTGWIGGWLATLGVTVPFTPLAPVIAAVVVGAPLYVLSCRQAFEAVDPRYEELAATLGDPPSRALWRVTLPLAAPGIAAGAVLAFARGLGEFGATIVLAGNMPGRTQTIALAVYSLLDGPIDAPRLWRLVAASVALAVAALLGWEALVRWQRRRLELDDG